MNRIGLIVGPTSMALSLMLLGGCAQTQTSRYDVPAASSGSAANTPVNGSRVLKPAGEVYAFTVPQSAQTSERRGIEGPSYQVQGEGYRLIFVTSPTVSLEGLGMRRMVSRSRLSTGIPIDVVRFELLNPVEPYRLSVAAVLPLPAQQAGASGVDVKLLAQGLCETSAACDQVEAIIRSAQRSP